MVIPTTSGNPGGPDLNRLLPTADVPLHGRLDLPGDKSITHRAFLFCLLAQGPCRVRGWLDAEDTRSSLAAVQVLGASVVDDGGDWLITPPAGAPGPGDEVLIDCGNSGTTARLLLGLLAGWLDPDGAAVRLIGDTSLSTRPMARVVDPLRAMGADLTYKDTDGRLPILIRGATLSGRDHALAVASAQVKSALQLAGQFADGRTTVSGADQVRDHTDRLLAVMGHERQGYDLRVPGDPSTAAFFQVAAALVPGSSVTATGQSLNRGRAGALDVLERAGAVVTRHPLDGGGGEPLGDVTVEAADLRAFTIEEPEVPSLIDELPVLAVLATQVHGRTVISGAAELKVKESDRLDAMHEVLSQLGADITVTPDGWIINGPTPLAGGAPDAPLVLRTRGDHRIAMSCAVAALVADGHVTLDDEACVAVSCPDFFDTLDKLLVRSTGDSG